MSDPRFTRNPADPAGTIRDNSFYPGMRGNAVELHRPDQPPSLEYQSTVDPAFREKYPVTSAVNAYPGPNDPKRTLAWQGGNAIRNFFSQEGAGGKTLNAGPALAAPAGAAALGIPAWLLGRLFDWSRGNEDGDTGTKAGIAGTALGAVLGAWLSHMRRSGPPPLSKAGSVLTKQANDPMARLMAVINNDYTLSYMQKQQLISAIMALNPQQAARAFNLLPGLAGAGAGIALARILGLGGIGMAIGGIGGGLLAGMSGPRRDSFGNILQ